MTTTTTSRSPASLPADLVRKLRRIILRAKIVTAMRGVLAVTVVLSASLLTAMAIDASVTIFDAWPRWVLSLSVMAVTLLSCWLWLVRPLARSRTLAGVARAIEVKHPEMQERISSAVELLTSRDRPEMLGSEVLIAALAQEAVRDARMVEARREVTWRSIRPFLLALGVVLAVFSAARLAWPGQVGRLLDRVVAPYRDLPNVFESQLNVVPGDTVVANGDTVQVEVQAANRAVHVAEFRKADAKGSDSAWQMTSLPPQHLDWPRFAFTCPPAGESFRYRIHAGEALTRYYTVQVVPRPTIERLNVQYEYPAYTGRSRVVEQGAAGDIRALAGTAVTVDAITNTPVTAAGLLLNDQPLTEGELIRQSPGATLCRFRFVMQPGCDDRWTIQLTKAVGKHVFQNLSDPHKIEAVADAKPIARITKPDSTTLRLKPGDHLPIAYAAGDDFGLSQAELLVDVDGRRMAPIPLPLAADANAARAPRVIVGQTELALSEGEFRSASKVTFQLRVRDNLPQSANGPQEGLSPIYAIRLDSQVNAYARQVVLAEEVALQEVLDAVLKDLQEAKKHSLQVRDVMQKLADPNLPVQMTPAALTEGMADRLNNMEKLLGNADAALRGLIARLVDGSFAVAADRLIDLADNHVARAQSMAGHIKLTDELRQRCELADETDFEVDRSIKIVTDMLKELQALAKMLQRAHEIGELADKQEELAEQMRTLLAGETPDNADAASQSASAPAAAASQPASGPASRPSGRSGPPMTPQEWQKQQRDVAHRMGELVRQTPRAMQRQMRQSSERVKDLVAETRRLATQQSSVADIACRVSSIVETEKALAVVAAGQADLAKRVAADAALAAHAKPMLDAAAGLKSSDANAAVAMALSVQAAMLQGSDHLTSRVVTAQLARQAQQLAQQQEALAQQAGEIDRAVNEAQAAADAAAKQAQAATQEAAGIESRLTADLAKLQQRQKELAAAAETIEKSTAANPLTPAVGKIKPSVQMAAAAGNMTVDKLALAPAAAKQAAQTADQLSKELVTAQAAAQKAAKIDAEIASAAAKAAQARAAADGAKKTAQTARQAATQAAGVAEATGRKAHDAQVAASAAKAVAATEPANPAKAAAAKGAESVAQTAQTDVTTSKINANAAIGAADRLDQAAQAADQAAVAADKQLQDVQKKAAELAVSADGVKKLSDRAAQVAADQKKIGEDVSAMAAIVEQIAKSTQVAKQAQQQQAQQSKVAGDASQRVSALAKPQQEAVARATELVEACQKTTPEGRQAAKENDPTAQMQQAVGAIEKKQTQEAAQAAQAAADRSAKLAQALRKADSLAGEHAKAAAAWNEAAERQRQAIDASADAARKQELAEAARQAKDANVAQRTRAALDAQSAATRAAQLAQQAADAVDVASKSTTQPSLGPLGVKAAQAAQAAQKAQADMSAAVIAAIQATDKSAQAADAKAKQQLQQTANEAAGAAKKSGQLAAASHQQARVAVQAAVQQAEQLASAASGQDASQAARLSEVAKALGALAKRAAEIIQQSKSGEQLKAEQLAGLKNEQQDVANGAAALADRVKKLSPQGDRLDTKAARVAAAAAEELQASQTPAFEKAGQAAQMLRELALRLGAVSGELPSSPAADSAISAGSHPSTRPAAGQPASSAVMVQGPTRQVPDQQVANDPKDEQSQREDLAAAAAALAGKQDTLAKLVQAMSQGKLVGLAAVRQERVNRDTVDVADDVGLLLAYASDLIPEKAARDDANLASAMMDSAMRSQRRAADVLKANSALTAEPLQRESAVSLNFAADSLERIGKKMIDLAKAAGDQDPNAEQEDGHLENIFDEAEKAAVKHQLTDIELAAKLLAKLANVMNEKLESAGVSKRSGESRSPRSDASRFVGEISEDFTAQLQAAGVKVSDWGLLPGELRDEILQGAADEGPEEYRLLIKRYFEEVAKRGDQRKNHK